MPVDQNHSIGISCPVCGQRYQARPEMAGRQVRCRKAACPGIISILQHQSASLPSGRETGRRGPALQGRSLQTLRRVLLASAATLIVAGTFAPWTAATLDREGFSANAWSNLQVGIETYEGHLAVVAPFSVPGVDLSAGELTLALACWIAVSAWITRPRYAGTVFAGLIVGGASYAVLQISLRAVALQASGYDASITFGFGIWLTLFSATVALVASLGLRPPMTTQGL